MGKVLKLSHEEVIKRFQKIHGDIYDYSKVYYTNGTKNKVIIICKNHGEFNTLPINHINGAGCQKCKKEKYILYIDNLLKENNLVRLGDYICNKTDLKCMVCNNVLNQVRTSNILSGVKCKYCSLEKLSNFYVDKYLIENNLPTKRIGEYINTRTKISWECLKCNNVWTAAPSSILHYHKGCFKCVYKNEKLAGEILKSLNLNPIKKPIIINNKKFIPDFYIEKYKLYVEYNGRQHYEPVNFGNISNEAAEENLTNQIIRDDLLRSYCKTNNINLFEIDGRVYTDKKLEEYITEYFQNLRNS